MIWSRNEAGESSTDEVPAELLMHARRVAFPNHRGIDSFVVSFPHRGKRSLLARLCNGEETLCLHPASGGYLLLPQEHKELFTVGARGLRPALHL